MSQLTALVDADSLIYRAAAGAESIDKDLNFAKNILFKSIDSIYEKTACSTMELFIGGEGNYREGIATLMPYKGRRRDLDKPKYYKYIRECMVEDLFAHVIDGQEAEDAVGIAAYKYDSYDDYIVCAIDKDMDMIAGNRYNYVTGETRHISESDALRAFYLQLLTGDMTDDIPGLYQQLLLDGEDELAKHLKGKKYKKTIKESLAEADTESKMYEEVLTYYYDYGQWDAYGVKRIKEIGQLLWIRRKENELWRPLDER